MFKKVGDNLTIGLVRNRDAPNVFFFFIPELSVCYI